MLSTYACFTSGASGGILGAMHPCLSCGACCAYFRVTFHWSETMPDSFGVPSELTVPVTPHLIAMKGTHLEVNSRCVALDGEVGKKVGCTIYDKRPGACREFRASFENGEPDERCDKARAAKGLRPLTIEDYKGV